MLWCSWAIQKKIFHLETAGTRTWKASKLTHLYGCVASAQSMSLFIAFLLGFKQLGSQVIYEWIMRAFMNLSWLRFRPQYPKWFLGNWSCVKCSVVVPVPPCWLSWMPLIDPFIYYQNCHQITFLSSALNQTWDPNNSCTESESVEMRQNEENL